MKYVLKVEGKVVFEAETMTEVLAYGDLYHNDEQGYTASEK